MEHLHIGNRKLAISDTCRASELPISDLRQEYKSIVESNTTAVVARAANYKTAKPFKLPTTNRIARIFRSSILLSIYRDSIHINAIYSMQAINSGSAVRRHARANPLRALRIPFTNTCMVGLPWLSVQQRLVGSLIQQSNKKSSNVVVVGSGIAGVCASIAAAENGLSVLLIDRAHGGGASAMSGGVIYAGGGTTQQKQAGFVHDTPENMFAYLRQEVGDAVDDDTLKRFCFESVERLEWLEKYGARFEASLCPYKTSYPTDKHYLYHSGSETAYPFYKHAEPAPRGHRMAQRGFSGYQLWRVLFDSAIRLGVQFQPATKAHRILLDENGAVKGVQVRVLKEGAHGFWLHKNLSRKIQQLQLAFPSIAGMLHRAGERLWDRAAVSEAIDTPAVILAAGGFAFNEKMRREYLPMYANVAPLGTPGDDGQGIKLGREVGGSVSHMNRMTAWRFLYPPTALLEGIVVRKDGLRMVSEDVYGSRLTNSMMLQGQGKAFLVLDSRQWSKAKTQLSWQTQTPLKVQRMEWLYWNHRKAASLEDLAQKLGVVSGALQETVRLYNSAVAAGIEDPMHKNPEYCSSITQGPFYGIDISATPSGLQALLGLTLGGLRVNGQTGLVLREDGSQINGLYAAGRNAVGVCSNEYISGLSLADGVFSGKRAGEHVSAARMSHIE
ncbi:hypothetical protein G7054_g1358 [Neopestalotiopsis clavispora]|nr:hypothetical protein G7054_g1358 [Neopestalotiopsis clavispora]